jgi:hypothetical protein
MVSASFFALCKTFCDASSAISTFDSASLFRTKKPTQAPPTIPNKAIPISIKIDIKVFATSFKWKDYEKL